MPESRRATTRSAPALSNLRVVSPPVTPETGGEMTALPGQSRAESSSTSAELSTPRQVTGRLLSTIASLIAVAAAAGCTLFEISRQVASGNSDGATVVLEGQALSAGHLLLSGWSLSLDSFWSLDAVFYAFAVAIDGLSGTLVNLVPAVIGAIVVCLSAYLASDGRRDLAAVAGGLTTVAPLALPSRAMALFFVQGPLHVATLLWCLLAFSLMAVVLWLAVGTRRLAALEGILGDFETLLLGAVPLLITGALTLHPGGRARMSGALLSAPVAGGVVALVVREISRIFGTYAVPGRTPSPRHTSC